MLPQLVVSPRHAAFSAVRALWVPVWLAVPLAMAVAAPLPLIDAHSQVDHLVPLERVIELMDEGGVAHTILSTRGHVTPEALVAFAGAHADRITPAVRTKGNPYAANDAMYYRLLEKQLAMPAFGAMAELIVWHAEKRNRKGEAVAPKWVVPIDSPQVQAALQGALAKGWPVVIHIEFASAGADRGPYMEQLEALLVAYPRHPFALIHMGQLDVADVARLTARHDNVHWLTSHANPVTEQASREPWTNLFAGARLAPEWKALIERYPERFVLAFDNVFAAHWGRPYLKAIDLWRKALSDLPPDVAHAVAHRNAERLWNLPPLTN